MAKPIIIHISGDSGAGKTTLIERLIPFLKKMGYKVGAIKHSHHGFDIDVNAKDSYRMYKAGADRVIVSSQDKLAIFQRCDAEENLAQLIEELKGKVDIILIEGYKDKRSKFIPTSCA